MVFGGNATSQSANRPFKPTTWVRYGNNSSDITDEMWTWVDTRPEGECVFLGNGRVYFEFDDDAIQFLLTFG